MNSDFYEHIKTIQILRAFTPSPIINHQASSRTSKILKMSIVGKYELLSDPEDPVWDKYLIAVGVSDAHREAGAMVRPSVEISEAGGKYTLKTLSELKNMEISFELGKEFDETTADNRVCKTTFTKEGNSKLVQVQQLGGVQSKTVREFSGDGLTATFTAGGVSAVRKYKRTA